MLRSPASCSAFLLVVLVASAASAQTEEALEEARALFGEGVQLTQEERWEEAAERFRRVMRVRATAQVKYNLALALAHTTALAEAAALLREVLDDRELDRRTRRDAQRLLEEVEPRLAHLTVRVQGDEAGLALTLDGAPLGIDRLGAPIAVDPGRHRLAVRRGEREAGSREVTLAEGESSEVTLVATAVHASEGQPDLFDDAPPASASSGNVLEEWWLWTIIGAVVVVAVGVGVGVAVAADGPSPVQGNLSPGVLEVTLP